MGYYVHIQLSWNGGEPEELKPIAETFLKEKTFEDGSIDSEIEYFLKSVIDGKSYFGGPKGQLWLWGIIGNYSSGENILMELQPFFQQLYTKDILNDFHKVILFEEKEQTEEVTIYQLDNKGEITMFSSEGKWCWNQY